eukprot:TRINITY_DN9336_c0_g1_i3.p1 TRINITY_DN9336_c0_g1~~TRINITY_DN9336_c0_g1_i3.p1  ORF type:complete len:970 (-),score=151.72 TRINITY_DN9336_c0_g1_i3:9-2726(-)
MRWQLVMRHLLLACLLAGPPSQTRLLLAVALTDPSAWKADASPQAQEAAARLVRVMAERGALRILGELLGAQARSAGTAPLSAVAKTAAVALVMRPLLLDPPEAAEPAAVLLGCQELRSSLSPSQWARVVSHSRQLLRACDQKSEGLDCFVVAGNAAELLHAVLVSAGAVDGDIVRLVTKCLDRCAGQRPPAWLLEQLRPLWATTNTVRALIGGLQSGAALYAACEEQSRVLLGQLVPGSGAGSSSNAGGWFERIRLESSSRRGWWISTQTSAAPGAGVTGSKGSKGSTETQAAGAESSARDENAEREHAAATLFLTLIVRFPTVAFQVTNALAFQPDVLRVLWAREAAQLIKGRAAQGSVSVSGRLALFTVLLNHLLLVLDDTEFFEQQQPLPLVAVASVCAALFQILFDIHAPRATPGPSSLIPLPGVVGRENAPSEGEGKQPLPLRAFVCEHGRALLLNVQQRNSHRGFLPAEIWAEPKTTGGTRIGTAVELARSGDPRGVEFVQALPFAVPFESRVALFRAWIQADKAAAAGGTISATIRRAQLVEDAMVAFGRKGEHLRHTVKIQFVNEHGLEEAGIDQAGVFREFVEGVVSALGNPNFGLLSAAPDGSVYPSPHSSIHSNHLRLFEFFGLMLGKSIYEGLLFQFSFAPFFLLKLLSLPVGIENLATLDPDVYKNLQFVKNYEGDVRELSLTFSVTVEHLGKRISCDLVDGGDSVDVTNDNKIHYVHAVADFWLNRQTAAQTAAFLAGFHTLIKKEWLAMFRDVSELQRLLCGDNVAIDVTDLRRHARYNGYIESDHAVEWFWELFAEMAPEERSALLRFVTSSSKPPLGGFAHLHPPFTIQRVDNAHTYFGFFSIMDTDRLPTSSTCFNLLKLPNYNRKSTMREKLRYAISSKAGFELS